MAAGCPVVGANRGGIPDIVSHGENGCLYNPDDPESLVAAVQVLLGNEDTRCTLRHAAREEAERWSWSSATEQLRRYYATVVHPSKVALMA